MLEGIVADVLVRVLGSYVDGLNRDSIRVGVWRGALELHNLRLRPDALAILFETLGLDLPVTVTAGHIGLLRLEVPWKTLRSAPVRVFMHDVTVVASPVSDGDQSALELRERRLKAARLATDEAVRDAKFSVRTELNNRSSSSHNLSETTNDFDKATQTSGSSRVARWGWRFTSRVVTRIVDNIQIDVENVIVQYEDSSSVRDKPYTATLAFDSLRACSTDREWNPVFIENPDSPIIQKVVFARGLVLNWEPGSNNSKIRSWILESSEARVPGQWSGFVRQQKRHAILPMNGELRIALMKASALAATVAGSDSTLKDLKSIPRVQMDLHFPQVHIALDDFQYHTLLSTIMYLSDIDRKVRPRTARGRWFWALDRLLPRFKVRREAAQQFNADGLRLRREKRLEYSRARNAVVRARRNGLPEPTSDAKIVEELENQFSFEDIIHFRDLADRELLSSEKKSASPAQSSYRLWSLFSRRGRSSSGEPMPTQSTDRGRPPAAPVKVSETDDMLLPLEQTNVDVQNLPPSESIVDYDHESPLSEPELVSEDKNVPSFRMGFLLGRGAIELKEGGFLSDPVSVSSLEFRELRLGIATRPEAGFLLDALLGTFEVIDVQNDLRVMYPRAPWAGEKAGEWSGIECDENPESTAEADNSNTSMSQLAEEWLQEKQLGNDPVSSPSTPAESSRLAPVLHSYPYEISNAIGEIRGEFGIDSTALPLPSPGCNQYRSSVTSESSSSISGLSDCGTSGASPFTREDLSVPLSVPLRYIAALRLNQEEATEGDWASGATRMAMDLAIGGMEVLVDGPKSAFISSVMFWHPREKMPSIMQFLMRAAAPRLASLRMDIQKALLERSVPMRMDILIRGPRFVFPGPPRQDSSLVLDLGTFAMETSTSPPKTVSYQHLSRQQSDLRLSDSKLEQDSMEQDALAIRYTEYKMAFSDLGIYVVSEVGRNAAERLVRPFSVHLVLEVLHNSSFIEAMTLSYESVNIAKVKLQGKLPSLRISVSHQAFRQILDAVKAWEERSNKSEVQSGIEPNHVTHSLTMSAELEKVRKSHKSTFTPKRKTSQEFTKSPLVSFKMMLDFEDLQLELRDSMARRIVTISSIGTHLQLLRRPDVLEFDYRVRLFTVTDGSRGATAPFRRLAYAGINNLTSSNVGTYEDGPNCQKAPLDRTAFIQLSYRGDLINHEQKLGVKILSLNLVCVRESYFALADFFYLKDRKMEILDKQNLPEGIQDHIDEPTSASDVDVEYADPFAAVGMTTSGAAQVLRQKAGRGMQISKQAIANRGRMSVDAELDGLNLTLVTAEGAIACLDITNCRTSLVQNPNSSVEASGDLGCFCVRDLTSAFDVYSETIKYSRSEGNCSEQNNNFDGWKLKIPQVGVGDIELQAHLKNIRMVYLHRFIIILKKYFDVLRQSLRPVLEMKGGLGEVFNAERGEDFPAVPTPEGRVNLNIVTECVDIVMPRHSQSPYEALRFFVPRSSITNVAIAAPGYQIGLEVQAEGVDTYVLYQEPAVGEGRALTKGGTEPVLRHITPSSPIEDLTPFSTDVTIVGKLDMWRRRRVPQVVLNADGLPVLKDGEEEREYDPAKWLPAIRVRVSAPKGISARLCEAEYSILYFTFTENVIERPDLEFTDIVRGLKTPVLPVRRPVQPIMFSSNKMPPNYQIIFDVPSVDSVIMSGADPRDYDARLIRTQLRDIIGWFDYGVDYRMTIEVNANMHSLVDIRPDVSPNGTTLITPIVNEEDPTYEQDRAKSTEMTRSVTFTWDRPFGFRSNIMVVASDLRIVVEPELFRDLGALTAPGFPFLKSSAPPPLLRFNGRLLIVTVSRPEIWLMANQFPGDGRSLVIRGDIIAKIQWAAVTGRQKVEIAANGMHVNLSNVGPRFRQVGTPLMSLRIIQSKSSSFSLVRERSETETPMLYPCDVSMRFDGSGYDPPENADGEAVKIPGSNLSINAESFLIRVDVNDTPLILAVGSKLIRLRPSELSQRPLQPGRFDQWIEGGDEEDAKLAVDFALSYGRLMFTDETAGRYVPIMEARIRNVMLRSNVPWLTNIALEFGLDLFNDEKGWWEPGIEMFPFQIAASQGRSGSRAVHVRSERNIDVNVTPNTVSGAARVSKALKSAIMDLTARLYYERKDLHLSCPTDVLSPVPIEFQTSINAKRPSVAAFCVRNETGRPMLMWLPYDSKKRPLHGKGGEFEVATPTEELLWTAIGANGLLSSDPNKNRQFSLSCILCLSGYIPSTFSTAQTGTWLVSLKPDMGDIASPVSGNLSNAEPVTLVWSVAMRDGVPCGCIRSVLRLINRTRTVLEVSIGGLRKPTSVGSALNLLGHDQPSVENQEPDVPREHEPHGLIRAGESWSIPIYAVHRTIRIRPAIFHAPDVDVTSDSDLSDSQCKSRVYYTFKWSDPLSKISALHEIGTKLQACTKNMKTPNSRGYETSNLSGPVLMCHADDKKQFFTMTIHPKIDMRSEHRNILNGDVPGWVDVQICAPLIIENLLPRPMLIKLALSSSAKKLVNEQITDEYFLEPLREAHVHSVGSNLNDVVFAASVDNSPVRDSARNDGIRQSLSRQVSNFLPTLPKLSSIRTGTGRYAPFLLKLDQERTISSRKIRAYCEFWIQNRSDTDLFFRDSDNNRETNDRANPKIFLRGRPPGFRADKFICFSGKWLAFQQANAAQEDWTSINTEVSEIDKPVQIRFEGLSLILAVRPARGKLQRALIATIRNAVWLENRTGAVLQWCQPAALNAHGIALSSRVHHARPGEVTPVHWDFASRKKAICLRSANENGSSEWIWSRAINAEGVEGEFVAKMYRPKRHEQYIARVTISKLRHGVLGIVVHKEDRNTPPYRIVNNCSSRSIAFRQSGVEETHPWLVRSGKSTRYSWDDPQAPVKKRSLVVEVIETISSSVKKTGTTASASGQLDNSDKHIVPVDEKMSPSKDKEMRHPKFDLNIDIITNHVPFANSNRFNPPLIVSVYVDGLTKVVTFADGTLGEISPRPQQRNIEHASEHNFSLNDIEDSVSEVKYIRNLDVEIFVNALGVSFVESTPTELAYLSVTGIHFRLDRFDGQQLVTCDIQDVQLDNQLIRCSWPVVLWSPPPADSKPLNSSSHSSTVDAKKVIPKPFFQLTIDGPHPSICQGIGTFRGIFMALQQMEIAADEDFVLRVWLFVSSLIEAAGGLNEEKEESLDGKDGMETGLPLAFEEDDDSSESKSVSRTDIRNNQSFNRLYVEHLELCPLKLNVSFTSSRTSTAAERIAGFRSLIRTLVAVLGNVENAEFRFNALQLHHMFDSVSHFRSLITEFYVSQGSNQKMVLLASNSLIGNPSALFDSIAIGTRDFFVEPANAKGSADFIAGIGRGSSSLLTNTVGGLVGSIGAIPRAMAQGLESAVGDRDYLAERDSIRGGRARIVSSPAQGLVTGALSFGHGIASAAAGLIRDPIQGATEEGASGFIKGLGRGFIGGVLKPITGALDLIAEPAAGFHSMMVSDRNRECAEPVRPPRAFWGAYGDQMVSYDLHAALGQAILEAMNGSETSPHKERVNFWTHLVAVHQSASEEQVTAFLWALMRRSTRAAHFQSKYLLDAQGNAQRAEKMRAGLITSKRLIITSLDGRVLWEHPLADIVDSHVSLEARDYLMVGVRPVGYSSREACAPQWKKIHCGSMRARNEMNASLRKAVQERRINFSNIANWATRGSTAVKESSTAEKESTGRREAHVVGASVEMIDLSNVGAENDDDGRAVELKSLNHDASVDGRRGIFTDMKMPGRSDSDMKVGSHLNGSNEEVDLSKEVARLVNKVNAGDTNQRSRSICMLVMNELDEKLIVKEVQMESGCWTCAPPRAIAAKSFAKFEADCGDDRVLDILGWVRLSRETDAKNTSVDDECTIRFFNSMLAANAFAIKNASWTTGSFKGGEKGDNIITVLTLKKTDNASWKKDEPAKMKRNSKATVEPLLFGRSKVSLYEPTIEPPHAPKEIRDNPNDPELIAKLSSLGFNEGDAHRALKASEGDVSIAYAKLVASKSASEA